LVKGDIFFVIFDVQNDDLSGLEADSDGVKYRWARLEAQDG
jgi:hypothetical protein